MPLLPVVYRSSLIVHRFFPMSPAQVLADNLRRVRDEIAEAAVAAGRDPKSVALVAVAKYVGPELTALLYEAGCKDLGESRPQQLWEKAEHERLAGAQWHPHRAPAAQQGAAHRAPHHAHP